MKENCLDSANFFWNKLNNLTFERTSFNLSPAFDLEKNRNYWIFSIAANDGSFTMQVALRI